MEQEKQIVIPGVPNDLLEDIDQMAAAADRPRAWIVRNLLAEIVAQKKSAKVAAKEAVSRQALK